jgi:DNA-binding response OmpR family regulator
MEAASDDVLHSGDVEIHMTDGLVLVGGQVVAMSVREYRLLVAMASRKGRIVSREDLYRIAWEAPMRNGDRSVDVYVHKLRVKLEEALPGHAFIHTHFGFGYRFSPEPSRAFHNSVARG